MNSKYRSGKSVAKNPTVPISADDPRVAWDKISNTKSRIGAEIDIVGFNGKSLVNGGTSANNISGVSGSNPVVKSSNDTTFKDILPEGVTNFEAAWDNDDIELTFDFNTDNEQNKGIYKFLVRVRDKTNNKYYLLRAGFGYQSEFLNTTSSSQTLTILDADLQRTGIELSKNIDQVGIAACSLYQTGDYVNATLAAYVSPFPKPTFTLGKGIDFYTVTMGPELTVALTKNFYGIIIEEKITTETIKANVSLTEGWTQASGLTTNSVSVIYVPDGAHRWVRVRYIAKSGNDSLYSEIADITPDPFMPVNTEPPTQFTSASVAWSGNDIQVNFAQPATNFGNTVKVKLVPYIGGAESNSLYAYYYHLISGAETSYKIPSLDLYGQFGEYYSTFKAYITVLSNQGVETTGAVIVSGPITRTTSLSTLVPNIATTNTIDGYTVQFNFGATNIVNAYNAKVASTGNIGGTFANQYSYSGGLINSVLVMPTSAAPSIDGVTLSPGDKVLIKNQTDLKQNGVYTYQQVAIHTNSSFNETYGYSGGVSNSTLGYRIGMGTFYWSLSDTISIPSGAVVVGNMLGQNFGQFPYQQNISSSIYSAFIRATNFDSMSEISNSTVTIDSGITNAGKTWLNTNLITDAIGTNDITFSQQAFAQTPGSSGATRAEVYQYFLYPGFTNTALPDYIDYTYASGGADGTNTFVASAVSLQGGSYTLPSGRTVNDFKGMEIKGNGIQPNTYITDISGSGPYTITLSNNIDVANYGLASGNYHSQALVYSGTTTANIFSNYYNDLYVVAVYYDNYHNRSLSSSVRTVRPTNPAQSFIQNAVQVGGTAGAIYVGASASTGARVLLGVDSYYNTNNSFSGIFAYDGSATVGTAPTTSIISSAGPGGYTFKTINAKIADWTITQNGIEELNGSNYVGLSGSGTYSFWAGADVASNSNGLANFSVTPAGAVIARKISIIGDGTTSDLINAGGGVFKVTNTGALTAQSATISGSITVNQQSYFDANVNIRNSSYLISTGTTGQEKLRLGSLGLEAVNSSGAATTKIYSSQGTVTVNGVSQVSPSLWSKKALFGSTEGSGWLIEDGVISSSFITLDSATYEIKVVSQTSNSTKGISLTAGYDTDYGIKAGNLSSPNFWVKHDGSLFASSADITGAIRATSGGFGTFNLQNQVTNGWTIGAAGITSVGAGSIRLGNYSIETLQADGTDFSIKDYTNPSSITTIMRTDSFASNVDDPKRIFLGDSTRQVEVAKSASFTGDPTTTALPSSNATVLSAYRSGGLRNMFTTSLSRFTTIQGSANPSNDILLYPSAIKGDVLIVYDNNGVGGDWRKIHSMYINTTGVATDTPITTPPSFTFGPESFNITTTSMIVSWSHANAQSWRVDRSSPGVNAQTIGSGNSTSGADFPDTGLTPNTSYTYAISIYTGLNQTGTQVLTSITRSTAATTTTTTAAPTTTTTTAAPTTTTTTAAPTFSITSTSKTSSTVTINWSNAPSFTAFYGVYRSGMSTQIVSGTSYTFTGLSASTSYTLNVEARNSSNAALAYADVTITTDAAPATTTTTAAPTTTTTTTTTTTAAPTTTTTTAAPCVCNYSTTETSSIHFAPECCPGGAPRAGSLSGNTVNSCCPNVPKTASGKYTCKAYDVNNSDSNNYFSCFSIGACQATVDNDNTRSACYF
jgi:hypothetical protein